MPTPTISQGQIAVDPAKGILYYKNNSGVLVNTSLNWSQPSDTLIQTQDSVQIDSNLIISGNLTVQGNTTTLNTETLSVEDNIVILNSGVTGVPSVDAGIEVERGSSTNVQLRWNETADKWQFTNDGTTYVNIASTTDVSNHEADTTNIHGIADTSALVTLTGTQTLTNKTLTSPTITGVSPVITLAGDLTGSVTLTNLGNGTLTATVAANSVALGTDTTGNYMSDVTAGTGVTVTHTPGEGSSATIALSASINDLSDVTISDLADGDFLRYSNIANAWINDPVNLSTDTVGDYVQSLAAGTGITLTNNSGEGATPTIAVTANTYDAYGAAASAASGAATALSNHESDTTNIHGIADTANLVTLADEQTLTNKTLTNPTIIGVSPVINLAGDLTGSVTLTDLGEGTLTATIAADSVALGTDTTGNYVQSLVAGTGITLTNNSGEGATPTIAVTANTYDAYGAAASAASGAATALSNHESDMTNIHGIADTSVLVTLAGTQTLTNKTLTSPTITGVSQVITLAGDLTGSVTLTNLGNGTLTSTIANNSVLSNKLNLLYANTSVFPSASTHHGSIAHSHADGAMFFAHDGNWIKMISEEDGYVASVTSGNNIVITNNVGIGGLNPIIAVDDNPSFGNVSASSLTISSIEIDPTGANSSDQVLRFDSENNKFIPGVASTVASLSDLTDVDDDLDPSEGHFLAWGGSSWNSAVPPTGMPIVSASAPSSPSPAQLWFDSENARTFIYYDSQWVEIGATAATSQSISKFAILVGDGTNSSYTVQHSFNTRDVIVQIYDNTAPDYETVNAHVSRNSLDSVIVSFAGPVPANKYQVVVIG